MKRYPYVHIVIANWNQRKLLEECLISIKGCTDYPNFKVIVVDNGSIDSSVDMIRRNFSWIKLIENEVNLGFAKANNQGIKHALREGADYILLLNNDTKVIRGDWLTRMVEVAEASPDVGIVGCKLIFTDRRIQHAGCRINVRGAFNIGTGQRDDGTYDEIKDVDCIIGAAFMIKRSVVQKIGLLDERFSPAFLEETDYCVRASMAGYRIIYNPRTTIIHYGGVTVKKHLKLQMDFVRHKNRLRFMLLNFPMKWMLRRPKYELKIIIGSVVKKKDETRKLSPLNAKLREDWPLNLITLLKAYSENLKCLTEILQKRRNRTSKVWY